MAAGCSPRPPEALNPPRLLYGLGIDSDAPVAALASSTMAGRSDLRWRFRSMPPGYDHIAEHDWEEYRRVDESSLRAARAPGHALYRLAYDDGTEFALDAAGTTVWARTAPGATLEDTATYLLGPVMGFVLRLRGITCLHAAAVEVEGRAIAFAGHAGSGKSTTAAAFARAGHAVLTDDVTALAELDGRLHVEPAYPRVRLWPEAVQSLFGSSEALPRITPSWDKRFLGLGDDGYRFQRSRLPLAAVYVLDRRVEGEGEALPIGGPDAVVELVTRGYSTRLLDAAMRAREFDALSRMVAEVPVFRLAVPEGIGRLGPMCRAIAERAAHAAL
jgi:hypothetical protein